jgi:hypothetical protein
VTTPQLQNPYGWEPSQEARDHLVNTVTTWCASHNVDIRLESSRASVISESDGVACSGYFEATTPRLAVATGKPTALWLPVMLHEWCHAQQWVENPRWFRTTESAETRLFRWAAQTPQDGTSLPSRRPIRNALRSCIALELDCERRVTHVLAALAASGLVPPGVPSSYAAAANAYLYFWGGPYVDWGWTWYPPGLPPYENQELVAAMPASLADNAGHYCLRSGNLQKASHGKAHWPSGVYNALIQWGASVGMPVPPSWVSNQLELGITRQQTHQ